MYRLSIIFSVLVGALLVTSCADRVADAKKGTQVESLKSEADSMAPYIFIKSKKIKEMSDADLAQYRVKLTKYIDLSEQIVSATAENPKTQDQRHQNEEILMESREISRQVDEEMAARGAKTEKPENVSDGGLPVQNAASQAASGVMRASSQPSQAE